MKTKKTNNSQVTKPSECKTFARSKTKSMLPIEIVDEGQKPDSLFNLKSKNLVLFEGRFGVSPIIQFWIWNLIVFTEGVLFCLLILALVNLAGVL